MDARAAARVHRELKHPDMIATRRQRPRNIGKWTQAEQLEASEKERRRRAYVLGIDLGPAEK